MRLTRPQAPDTEATLLQIKASVGIGCLPQEARYSFKRNARCDMGWGWSEVGYLELIERYVIVPYAHWDYILT